MIHVSKREDSRKIILECLRQQCPSFSTEVVIVADREKGIDNSVDHVLSKGQRVMVELYLPGCNIVK